MRSAGPGDDQARFLADLRALRDTAAIGYDELAARAHYPSDILKEAENGPYLPTLPILAAYVRACEGDILEWEERWRRVANEAAGDPGLPVRPAGASPAAVAGARAGVGVAPPDVYDPERIKAALRGGHQPADQAPAARDTGSADAGWSFSDAGPTGWNAAETGWGATSGPPAGWDTGGIVSANGKHRNGVALGEDQAPEETAEEGQFADSWAQDQPAGVSTWSDLPQAEPGGELAWPELADTELTPGAAGDGVASAGELGWTDAKTEMAWRAADAAPTAAESAAFNDTSAARLQKAAPRQDRLYPLRLLAIVVIAALIGSGLVLLFR